MPEKDAKPLPDYAIQLARCGEAHFGSSWSGDLARHLSEKMGRPFDQAIVRRWARGGNRPPAYAWMVIG